MHDPYLSYPLSSLLVVYPSYKAIVRAIIDNCSKELTPETYVYYDSYLKAFY